MKKTSLKSLASHLQLAEGTVSRALNDYPDISAKTRQRVHQAARQFGYKPNQTARRLATGVAEAVGYVMPHSSGSLSEPFVAQLLQGLGDVLGQRGWDLLVSQAQPDEDETALIQRLITSARVSGIVLSRPLKNDRRVELLTRAKFPFVVHGRTEHHKAYAWYDVDSHAAFREAVTHLQRLGHQRIAFIGAPLDYSFAQTRLDGYRDGLREHQLATTEQLDALVRIGEMSDDCGERLAGELLDSTKPPSALLCVSDVVALGALAAVRERGKTPGQEVSVIGYDGLNLGRHANPPLTTMAQPQADSGRQLATMLLTIIDGGDPATQQQLHAARLLRRDSDGPYQN